jgi:hypothetical protein
MVSKRSKGPRVESYALGNRAVSHWQHGLDGYDHGTVMTPEGTACAYMQGDDRHEPLTRLDFTQDGRHYIVSVNKRYSRRGVVSFVRRMLREAGIPS